MSFPYGNNIKLRIDGSSHDEYMTGTLSGFPEGVDIDRDGMSLFLRRRAPGRDPLTTARRESDEPLFLSGVGSDEKTDGSIIEFRIFNRDAHPSDYSFSFNRTPRPSHADFAAVAAYGDGVDLRGGGHFSGRLTSILAVAGWLAIQYLKAHGISVFAHVYSVGNENDESFDLCGVSDADKNTISKNYAELGISVLDPSAARRMREAISEAKSDGDSIGGTVECAICGLPAGLGEHMFAGIEGRISSGVFSVPGVKGIEFGRGFAGSALHGSEYNDVFVTDGKTVRTETNNCGGILGGMTDGMPVVFRATFKPTPSISKSQRTVDLSVMENATVSIGGRHDPCIVLRAVPVIEAAAALAICDILLDPPHSAQGKTALRDTIEFCDRQITDAFSVRMDASGKIGRIKAQSGDPVYVPEREKILFENIRKLSGKNAGNALRLYDTVLRISRCEQTNDISAYRQTGFEDRKLYLIGHPLGHSMSPELHKIYCDYSYRLKDILPDELEGFIKCGDYDGFNVTIPYKKSVIPYLDVLSPAALECQAVNTVVKLPDGRLYGDNTDVEGFIYMLETAGISVTGKDVFILGNGGAASAVRAAVSRLGCSSVKTFTRRGEGGFTLDDVVKEADKCDLPILINATPIGMYPNENGMPVGEDVIEKFGAVADLVYNPYRTNLICTALKHGILAAGGLPMLAYQAGGICSLITGKRPSNEAVEFAATYLENKLRHIILIGMPGCGKSTAAKRVGEILGMPVIDIDREIFYSVGKTPAQIIEMSGEEEFRRIETGELLRALRHSPSVIATGGGVVTREENFLPIKRGGKCVLLLSPGSRLATEDRPLSLEYGVDTLWERRRDSYFAFADAAAEVEADPDITAARIIEVIK